MKTCPRKLIFDPLRDVKEKEEEEVGLLDIGVSVVRTFLYVFMARMVQAVLFLKVVLQLVILISSTQLNTLLLSLSLSLPRYLLHLLIFCYIKMVGFELDCIKIVLVVVKKKKTYFFLFIWLL